MHHHHHHQKLVCQNKLLLLIRKILFTAMLRCRFEDTHRHKLEMIIVDAGDGDVLFMPTALPSDHHPQMLVTTRTFPAPQLFLDRSSLWFPPFQGSSFFSLMTSTTKNKYTSFISSPLQTDFDAASDFAMIIDHQTRERERHQKPPDYKASKLIGGL